MTFLAAVVGRAELVSGDVEPEAVVLPADEPLLAVVAAVAVALAQGTRVRLRAAVVVTQTGCCVKK